ncbi:MAG: hypothetical protein ABEJ28_10720 [Salinigranum sp.]
MNKHFQDSLYYLRRAGEHAKTGIEEELEPIEARVREALGQEEEPEPNRVDRIQEELRDIERRAQGETRKAIKEARERIRRYREESAPEAPAE